MSREIKFRAWSNGIKKGSKWIFEPQMMYDEKMGDCLVWKSQGQNIEVMQYTGLKDKNGVEIYEGDIIKSETLPNRIGEAYPIKDIVEFHYIMLDSAMTPSDAEVIGNVYENPDLLKG